MHDQALADDVGCAAADRHARQAKLDVGTALRIGLQRRQVAGMVLGVGRAVRLAARVEVAAGAQAVALALDALD